MTSVHSHATPQRLSGAALLLLALACTALLLHQPAEGRAASAPSGAAYRDWFVYKRRLASPYPKCKEAPERDALCENCLQETQDSVAYKYCCVDDEAYAYCQGFLKRFTG